MVDFRKKLNQNKGYDVFEEKEKKIEKERSNNVYRFWLPPENGAKIVFLDDNPPIIEEHQLKIAGSWKNWFTCLRTVGEACPICDVMNDNPSTVGFYTIIDTSEWKDSRGNVHKNEIKLLPAKYNSLKMLRRYSKKHGGLQNKVFDVYRTNSDAYNIGDVYDFEAELTDNQIKELNEEAAPVDYAEVLAPKSPAELKEIIQGKSGGGQSFEDYEDDDFDVNY
jgi:hypothetical protein